MCFDLESGFGFDREPTDREQLFLRKLLFQVCLMPLWPMQKRRVEEVWQGVHGPECSAEHLGCGKYRFLTLSPSIFASAPETNSIFRQVLPALKHGNSFFYWSQGMFMASGYMLHSCVPRTHTKWGQGTEFLSSVNFSKILGKLNLQLEN
jgi:hypothetical protein